MRAAVRASALLAFLFLSVETKTHAAPRVEILRSTGGLPPHIVGLFEEPLGFQQAPGGRYYVFDRRAHTVYSVDADKTSARRLIEIGQEQGRILQPRGFDVRADGSFVVADAPPVDPAGRLWVSLSLPYTYVYDPHGDKVRTMQLRAAGTINPTSLFFTRDGRLFVTHGCYEFHP